MDPIILEQYFHGKLTLVDTSWHPFIDWVFHEINHPATEGTPISGNHHIPQILKTRFS